MEKELVDVLLSHRGKLLSFVRSRLGDPDLAEDLFQEALLRAIRKAPDIQEEEQMLSWFYRVLRNAIIDQYRRNSAEDRRIDSVAATLSEGDFEEVEKELCECFMELLPALKPEYREMIEKLELGHEDPESAAARLGIERNNLKVRRHRARQQLKERLEQTCRTCADHGCLDCTCKKG